jgi:hypothetical protein
VSKYLRILTDWRITKFILGSLAGNYLRETGWYRSSVEGMVVDSLGSPLPWLTFSALDFIDGRLRSDMRLLEFGSGNSTKYFSKKVSYVCSFEHDRNWYQKLDSEKSLYPNVHFYLVSDENAASYLEGLKLSQGLYDVILVDGKYRNECIQEAIKLLSKTGVLVLDDSDRVEYAAGRVFLKELGFREIQFTGLASLIAYKKATSVFYRDLNCLDI